MSDIEDWDVSVIEDFGFLFSPTSKGSLSTADMGSFNADISKWNVAQGTNFEFMFFSMKAFNADLSLWDVSQGTDFSSMFMNANSFDRDLSKWKAGQTLTSTQLRATCSATPAARYTTAGARAA